MPTKVEKKERHVVITWGDVRTKVLDVVAEGKPWGNGPNASHHHAQDMVKGSKEPYGPPKCNPKGYGHNQHACKHCQWKHTLKWQGGSWGDTLDNLRNGFRAPEFRHSAEYVPMANRKRPTWSEEPDGDLDIGRLYGGYDNVYLVPSEQERKPGIRVQIEFAFAAGVAQKTIERYGAWVAGLLGSMEASGYDLTVDLWIPLDGLFEDGHRRGGFFEDYGNSTRDNVLIRVKRENEVADFTNWSALFGPTGYRHIGFAAKLVAGDKLGLKCSSGLGCTLSGTGWRLEYDKDNSILKIRADQRGDHRFGGDPFPKDALNKQALDLGLIAEGQK